jgi:DNA-binding beta-propeller fold protein YncE
MPISVSHLRVMAGVTLLAMTPLAACSSGLSTMPAAKTASRPERILAAPKEILAAGQPQTNGAIWMLAGNARSKRLFEFSFTSGQAIGSVSVSNEARSMTESPTGMLGLALGTGTTGALELLNGNTGTVALTVRLGAPARDVVVGADGATFYVLTGSATSSRVTIVDSANGRISGTVPVPQNTVSIAPDVGQTTLFALQSGGDVSEIAIAGGSIMTRFAVGDSGRSLALSPDGGTLYVLKNVLASPNVAVVDLATESVRQVLPAPSNCLQVLVSASGNQLYQVVGSASYGNIQVVPL